MLSLLNQNHRAVHRFVICYHLPRAPPATFHGYLTPRVSRPHIFRSYLHRAFVAPAYSLGPLSVPSLRKILHITSCLDIGTILTSILHTLSLSVNPPRRASAAQLPRPLSQAELRRALCDFLASLSKLYLRIRRVLLLASLSVVYVRLTWLLVLTCAVFLGHHGAHNLSLSRGTLDIISASAHSLTRSPARRCMRRSRRYFSIIDRAILAADNNRRYSERCQE